MTDQVKAFIQTAKGSININLYPEQAPVTVASFVNLSERGFYNGLNFHRVVPNFVIQGGCPNGDGRGEPGYRFEDECSPDLPHDKPGILSMANAGPGTNGSQFFVTHTPTPHLNGNHTVFGAVVGSADMDVVNAIAQGDTIESITIEGDTTALKEQTKDRLNEWNAIIDKRFPNLAKS